MASVSGEYTSATSYEVTISGMTVGQKYHLFVADLNSSGNTTGYYCRYSQTATSTNYTYEGTCGSAYSAYNRTLRLFCTGTTATSHSVGAKYQSSDLPSSYTENKTSYMTAWSGGSGTTYKTNAIYFRTGTGVEKYELEYANSTETGNKVTITGRNTSTTVYVRNGTNATLTSITYEANCGKPYNFVEWDSTWTSIKETLTQNGNTVYSDGTKYIKLAATYTSKYYYQIKAHGVDGTFPDGSTYWSSAVLSTTGNGGWVSYPASNIPTPTRTGYTFKGWSVSANSTAVVTSIEFTATSESSSSPTAKEVWAVWERSTSTITLDGNGGKWDAATGRLTITKNVGDVLLFANYSSLTRTGYTLLGWSANKSATAATYATDGYVSVGAADATYYAVWQRMVIAPFYWDSEGTDAALIAKGQPVSNLTAARWNKLLAKIKEVAEATGGSFGGVNVSAGGTFYATEFNEARSGILNLSGHGTLPGTKASDDEVLAALFEGSGSLKTALNAAINQYNNS